MTGGSFLQCTGLVLAAFVGATGAIVILALVATWVFTAPRLPPLPTNADPAAVKPAPENYKALQQIRLEPLNTLLDSIVIKILLPVFTSILGYIFGSRSESRG